MKTKILFVCLGNICRSPAAEGVFCHLIKQRDLQDRFELDSAGTGGWHVGEKADKRMRIAAENRGIKISSIARQIVLDDFNQFDFILTMDKDNLLNVENLRREVLGSSNTIIKPILSYIQNGTQLDVPDPYYGGEKGFEVVLDLLEVACEALLLDLLRKD